MGREFEVRLNAQGDRVESGAISGAAPLGDLLQRLTTDMGELIRQEIDLAKAEMREVGAAVARDAGKIAAAAALALAGALALIAFLVVGLGVLLGGRYWLSALIVGLVAAASGGMVARNAITDVKHRGLAPRQTVSSLRDDVTWVRREAVELKRELTP